ncbi:DNA-processing protein DprA [Microbacterium sp. YY-01]|uniref:DNA-processing protein DprA n=1 Tax=Microbacterium sp. YY-01 TaxID=3421634 RepID=UPI003D164A3C
MIHDYLTRADAQQWASELRPDRDAATVLARIAWSVITEPGDGVAGTLIAHLGPVEALRVAAGVQALPDALPAARDTLVEAQKRWRLRLDRNTLCDAVAAANRLKVGVLFPDDPLWPKALDDLGNHAPHMLWLRGNREVLTAQTSIAIVGARAATRYGEHAAAEIAGDLASSGITVVSGGAYGIDGVAHRATLGVDGQTVAFLAGGVDRLYPAGHSQLLERIAATGVLVSEVPCGTAPTKWRFLARNRLIGAASNATVVIEAGQRSGSLNTAGHAATLGRPLGAVPGPITSAASAGCHRLLREYDAACIRHAADARELLGLSEASGPITTLTDKDVLRLTDALSSRSPRTTEDLARRSGLAVARIQTLLGLLLMQGVVAESHNGWRRLPT